jgi:FkbM family methyltransferase
MLSYAQNQEDVLLWRVLSDVDPAQGFYIDIGANHPVIDSVTKHFYDAGWHGINVEPVAAHAERLRAERPRDVNLHAAVGAEHGTLTLHRVVENDGLSTIDPAMAEGYRGQGMTIDSVDVPVVTLAEIFDEHVDGPVHFLKIDVEGHEQEVIEGGNWSRDRPHLLVIEATKPENWEHRLAEVGYERVLDDGINYVYVAEEHAELGDALRRPVTVVDRFVHFEWLRRAQPFELMLEHYALPVIVDEMLGKAGRRQRRESRAAAEALVTTLVNRDDLVRTFAHQGPVDHEALLGWALDVDPGIDRAIEALQVHREQLEALRRDILAHRNGG